MTLLTYIVGFITLIMVITAIHEAGHYSVARFFKVTILDFSIGMGKSLKSWKDSSNTEFHIRALPIGGFVRMKGEDESQSSNDSFSSKKYYQKVLILLAGPIANFVLAIILLTGLNIYGNSSLSSLVGYVEENSPSYDAGFQEGDLILEIDSYRVFTRSDAQMALSRRLGETGNINFLMLSDNSQKSLDISIESWLQGEEPSDLLRHLGINIPIKPIIGQVLVDSPADVSGLRANDEIMEINNELVSSWSEIKGKINNNLGLPASFKIKREDKIIFLSVSPKFSDESKEWLVGISASNKISPEALIYQRDNPLNALMKASIQTYNVINDSFEFLYKMLTGYVSPKNLGGPVMIGQFAGESLIYGGLYSFILLIGYVSIGLGVINLVPIPILDGGQILILSIERIKGSPISPKILDFTYRFGISAVVLLMIFAFMNDVSRIGV
ncbi:RIP metalloprotease RseP [SAR86 cluster bacterium]|nr:RIP metalloprotease RseP [SAR86 cluster bacterium]